MIVCLILIGSLLLVGGVLRLLHHDDVPENMSGNEIDNKVAEADDLCCGLHSVCEKLNESKLSAVEYYDDEELDRYAGIEAGAYNDVQIEEFRDVLLTLLPSDLAGWRESLNRRGIALPLSLHDEFMLLLKENI